MATTSRQQATSIANEQRLERLAHYIDLERYPIHDLSSPRAEALIERCHRMMREDTLCLLPGFLTAAATQEFAQEINSREDQARTNNYMCTAYGWMNNEGFPADHPRRMSHLRSCGMLTTEQLAPDGPSMELFRFDELREFVRRLLEFETLYQSVCPTLAVQINLMRQDQCFGWHFDANDGVVSLLIQEPDEGGAFEYALLIRAEDDENYTGVKRLFEGLDAPRAEKIPAGTFTLFMGRRSVHRVAPVGVTRRARVTVLYSYDRNPNMVFPESVCSRLLQPNNEPYLGLETLTEGDNVRQ